MSAVVPNNAPVAIVAGGGSLPAEVAHCARAAGRDVFIVGIRGVAEEALRAFPHEFLELGQVGRLFALLRKRACTEVVLIGAVTRPDLKALRFDFGTLTRLPDILSMALGGDDTLLVKIADYFENEGISVIGAHEIAPGLTAPTGVIAGRPPDKDAHHNMAQGWSVLQAVGSFDMGQAAVVMDGRVVAIEGAEGTDGLLERSASMRATGRLPKTGRRGILIKGVKPGQDLRVDLPTIGEHTVVLANEAKLAGIVLEAGRVLIAERAKTLACARRLGLFIYGINASEVAT